MPPDSSLRAPARGLRSRAGRATSASVSAYFVARNSVEEIRDTLLHEIAHALVGPGHGHDAVWEARCLEVGAIPRRCGQADMPSGAWQATCPGCAKRFHRHRRPKRGKYYCVPCGPSRGALSAASRNGP